MPIRRDGIELEQKDYVRKNTKYILERSLKAETEEEMKKDGDGKKNQLFLFTVLMVQGFPINCLFSIAISLSQAFSFLFFFVSKSLFSADHICDDNDIDDD